MNTIRNENKVQPVSHPGEKHPAIVDPSETPSKNPKGENTTPGQTVDPTTPTMPAPGGPVYPNPTGLKIAA